MIANEFITHIEPLISSISWVDKFGAALTQIVERDDVRVPVVEAVAAEDCDDALHYKLLIPDGEKRGIVYFEETTAATMMPHTGGGLYKFNQGLRCMAWINFPKSGFPSSAKSAFLPIHRAILSVGQREMIPGVTIQAIQGIKDLTQIEAQNLFRRYKYQSDVSALTTWPYGLMALEFNLTGFINPRCLSEDTGGAEIGCPI